MIFIFFFLGVYALYILYYNKANNINIFVEIHLPLETTTTPTTPRYVVTKPHKPLVKEKPMKPKSGKTRKKEFENKNEDKQMPSPEIRPMTPAVSLATTTTQVPSIILQQRNSSNKINLHHICILIVVFILKVQVIIDNSL